MKETIYILFSYYKSEKTKGERINSFISASKDKEKLEAIAETNNKQEEKFGSDLHYFVSEINLI